MRTTQLRAVTCAYLEEAAAVLAAAAAAGDEVGFEVVEQRARGYGTPLYCYRPLTAEFVSRHAAELGRLETYLPAIHALAGIDGLTEYLLARGVAQPPAAPREAAELALRMLLAHAYEGAEPEFEFSQERFERGFDLLQRAGLDDHLETVIVALLRGLAARSPEVALVDGVTLMQPEAFDLLPPQSGWLAVGEGPIPSTLVVLDAKHGAGSVPERLRILLTALRLFSPGVALEPIAWMRSDKSAWQPLALDVRGHAHGAIVIAPEQEDELRAFCSLITRRAGRESVVGWALRRFELGCEHDDRLIALSDHLLALRALLEPEGPRSGRLAARLAALCAVPEDRDGLAERVAHAISLERTVIAGLAPHDRGVERLVDELADDLRALLRDVLCGHLDADLVRVADALLAQPVPAGDQHPAAQAEAVEAAAEAFEPAAAGAFAPVAGDVGDGELLAGDWPAAELGDGKLFR